MFDRRCLLLFAALCAGSSFGQTSDVARMMDGPLTQAYPEKRKGIDFRWGRFSRDGKFLALVLSSISSGEAEQVWMYELSSGTLVPVTERPHNSMLIFDIAWSGDGILYVSGGRTPNGILKPYFLAATMEHREEIKEPPAEITEIFKQPSKKFHINYPCCLERYGPYEVKIEGKGHGAGTLSMRRTDERKWTEIAGGGFELLTFHLDETRSRVIYPLNGIIVEFDLSTRQSRILLKLNNPFNPFMLDVTADGKTVAYIEPGSCHGAALGVDKLRIEQPSQVCFLHLQK
jgi:hypothetical protein